MNEGEKWEKAGAVQNDSKEIHTIAIGDWEFDLIGKFLTLHEVRRNGQVIDTLQANIKFARKKVAEVTVKESVRWQRKQ
jgi:hypothetical protein